jgi:hypothetical protein
MLGGGDRGSVNTENFDRETNLTVGGTLFKAYHVHLRNVSVPR